MFEPGIALPLRGESLAVTPLGPISRAVLRCRAADIDPVSERLGIILPRAACRSAHDQALSALWLGPDEWLMMSTEPTPEERSVGTACVRTSKSRWAA